MRIISSWVIKISVGGGGLGWIVYIINRVQRQQQHCNTSGGLHSRVVSTSSSWRPSGSWSSPCRRRSVVTRQPTVARTRSSRPTCRPWAVRTLPLGQPDRRRPWPRGYRHRSHRSRRSWGSGRTATWSIRWAEPWRRAPASSWWSWRPPIWAPTASWSPGTWTSPAMGTAARTSCVGGVCLDL